MARGPQWREKIERTLKRMPSTREMLEAYEARYHGHRREETGRNACGSAQAEVTQNEHGNHDKYDKVNDSR